MDDNNFAPVSQKLSYNNGNYNNFDMTDDNQPGVAQIYPNQYASDVAKQYQACPTKVMKLYFSDANIERIQKKIKKEVYKRSKGKFRLREDQDPLDLNVSMRTVYLLNAADLPMGVVRQVKKLNEETVQYIVPDMITNLEQYYGYLRDIRNPINPIQLPINMGRAGRRLLPSVTQVWGI